MNGTIIHWSDEDRKTLFIEAQRLLAAGFTGPQVKLWSEAQKALPADKIRTVLFSSVASDLKKKYAAWLKPTVAKKRKYSRSLPLPPAPSTNGAISHFRFCPACGTDFTKLKFA